MSSTAKIVEIEWADSCGIQDVWESRDADTLHPSLNVSVGYLCEATAKLVTICQSLSPSQLGRRFTIPRGCIRRMRTLKH